MFSIRDTFGPLALGLLMMSAGWNQSHAAESDVRVMSYNIRHGNGADGDNRWDLRKDFLVETIQAFQPDLLGTQETLVSQRDYLAQKLPEYDHFGVGRDDGIDRGEMTAIFYRKGRFEKLDGGHFWLSQTPEQAGSKSWDSSLPRMVTWVKLRDRRVEHALPVVFLNTHFDHRGTTARVEAAKLLRQKIQTLGQGASVVVTGDFNTDEGTPPYQALFDRMDDHPSLVVDSFRTTNPDKKQNEGTFSGFKADDMGGPRIDWIGVSHDWQIRKSAIDRTSRDGRTASDHFPVTAVLRHKPEDKPVKAKAIATPEVPPVSGGNFEVESLRDITYFEGKSSDRHKHQLDLFLPKGARDFPVLFFIHGGAWTSGDRKLYGLIGKVFARNGIGTVVTSYRLSPAIRHPGHIEDVARAFAWTHKNIAQYGGRPDRIFVSGQSAGGHLAALLCTDETYVKAHGLTLKDIRGAIPISGIYTFRTGELPFIIGNTKAAAENASPVKHVSGDEPPFLILYAASDIPRCDEMSQQLAEGLKANGIDAEYREIPHRNHLTIIFQPMLGGRDTTVQAMLRFIARHSELQLKPRRTAEAVGAQ